MQPHGRVQLRLAIALVHSAVMLPCARVRESQGRGTRAVRRLRALKPREALQPHLAVYEALHQKFGDGPLGLEVLPHGASKILHPGWVLATVADIENRLGGTQSMRDAIQ